MVDTANNYFNLFLQGKYTEGIQQIEQLLQSRTPSSDLYLAKALHLYRLGHLAQSLQEIGLSISTDPLNYQAYFNLSSMMYNRGDREMSFKNLVCANSSLNVLVGFKTKEESYLDRAIQLSFNNKEAKALKSVLKLSANKNIDALNQINFALYLDPSNASLLKIQQRVYASMGMKELKTLGANMKKKKYDRLETTLQVPSEETFQKRVKELMEEFNRLVKIVKEEGSYIVSGKTIVKEDSNNHEVSKFVKEQESRVRWVELKPVASSPSKLKTSILQRNQKTESRLTQQPLISLSSSPLYLSRDKEGSTLNGSIPSDISQDNHNDSLSLFQNSSPVVPTPDKSEPILQDNSFNSLSRFQNLSISNISPSSKIKVSRIGSKNVLDLSDCLINLLDQPQKQTALQESLNLLNDSKDSLNQSGSQKVELKLPVESLAGLGKNEKIVLAIQRVKVNEQGQKEEVEELYEIVANNQGLQMRRQGKQITI